jgi:peptidoglycan-associated lipoprotein
MSDPKKRLTLLLLGVCLPVSAALSGCAHVKPEEMESRLSDLRSELQTEIAEGDGQTSEELSARMGGLESSLDGLTRRVQALEADLAAMEREFGAEVQRLETALRFNMPVYFEFDKAEVRAEDYPVLKRFAEVVAEYYPSSLITVEGFTDHVGDPDYNIQLGKRRAESVMAYLVIQEGLGADKIRAVSYGEDSRRQVAVNSHGPGNEGWQNRRVALVVDHGGG